jgi:hypothetical protein
MELELVEDLDQYRTLSSMYSSDSTITLGPNTSEMVIRRIITIWKTENGMNARILVESRGMMKLMVVDWQELRGREEVEKFVPKKILYFVDHFSSIKGSWEPPLFTTSINSVVPSLDDCADLVNGKEISYFVI